jgi:hypothetical protein
MIVYIKKFLLTNMPELLQFNVNNSNRRSSGELVPSRFRKKNCQGIDISYLGVKLYNQVSKQITEIEDVKKFKIEAKKYLLDKIDLLLALDQHKTRNIS